MKIRLVTPINKNHKTVFEGFNKQLFEYLSPAFPKITLMRFDGSKKGDFIHLRFGFPLYRDWISEITEDNQFDDICYFTDEGRKLPPGITYWKHQHIVKSIGDNRCEIVDDIEFKSWNTLFSLLFYPLLYLSFYPRKKLYTKFFSNIS